MELLCIFWDYFICLMIVATCANGHSSGKFRTERENDKMGLSCSFDKCNVSPEYFCLNGGSCVFDQSTCESSCRCAEGYSGSLCQTPDALKVVSSDINKLPSEEIRENMKNKDVTDEMNEFQDHAISSSTIITTQGPKYNICKDTDLERTEKERACSRTFKCKYGVCEKSLEENKSWSGYKYDCKCDVGAIGLMCEHRCCLKCDHGTCAVHNGTEYCSCEAHYKGMTCDEYVPIPVKIKVHEVTWYLWVVGGCAASFLVLITLSIVVPYYMWKHRVILIMKIVHYFQAYEDDDDKQWDAFISYKAHEIDEHFVVHSLYPKLEKELGFKLCLHFRDFIPGETITNNIINAVEASRRTIIIISPRYIQSEFTRFEYQKAQHEMLKRKHRIIPILLEDISSVKSGMDKNLKGIIDSVTYLEWPEPSCEKKVEKFWKRLILSLPKKKEASVDNNVISGSNFSNNLKSSSSIMTANSCPTFSAVTFNSDSNKVSNWLSSNNSIGDQNELTDTVYCEIKSVDERLNKLNISTIPTLSEEEEEEMVESYRRAHPKQFNSDNTEGIGRSSVLQTQVSYIQSEVSSPTDSLTPLWINKSDEDTVEKGNLRKFLDILDSVTEA